MSVEMFCIRCLRRILTWQDKLHNLFQWLQFKSETESITTVCFRRKPRSAISVIFNEPLFELPFLNTTTPCKLVLANWLYSALVLIMHNITACKGFCFLMLFAKKCVPGDPVQPLTCQLLRNRHNGFNLKHIFSCLHAGQHAEINRPGSP